MFAFVDETGNTGANLFDEAQPYFLTGALITKSDFDLVYGADIRAVCKSLDIAQIHANQLGAYVTLASASEGDLRAA